MLRRLFAFLAFAAFLLPAFAAGVPELTFTTATGEPLSLAALRGKVVYLDYWASWCAPCRQSFPWMEQMQARYGERGFVVLAVNLDRERAEAQRFLAAAPAQFRIVYDPNGDTARSMKVKGMPSSFLIGRDGEIVSSHIGFRDTDRAPREAEIRTLLDR
jgi:cytochrome c biogenesis protein CcmG, thiol:disulfide interchange protein DsbE